MTTPPTGPKISEKGLRYLWRWARDEIAEPHEAYIARLLVRLLVATTLRDRGLPLDDDQRRCLEETMVVLLEHARESDA